jgi:2-keto-3-deoxy-galactonokinase
MTLAYSVKVNVDSLDHASRLLKLLEENGYEDVSMDRLLSSEDNSSGQHAEWVRSSNAFGRFNELILTSLFRAGATKKNSSVTIDEIIENMKGLSAGREMLERRGEGVVSRTISMVASAVLGNKYGWIAYDDEKEPRRYWLTQKGLEHTGVISSTHATHNQIEIAQEEETS